MVASEPSLAPDPGHPQPPPPPPPERPQQAEPGPAPAPAPTPARSSEGPSDAEDAAAGPPPPPGPEAEAEAEAEAAAQGPPPAPAPAPAPTPGSPPSAGASRLGPETFRLRFRQFRYQDAAGPREAFRQLRELSRQWLRPDVRTKEQIVEMLVQEQLFAILPAAARARRPRRRPDVRITG